MQAVIGQAYKRRQNLRVLSNSIIGKKTVTAKVLHWYLTHFKSMSRSSTSTKQTFRTTVVVGRRFIEPKLRLATVERIMFPLCGERRPSYLNTEGDRIPWLMGASPDRDVAPVSPS